MSLNIQHLENEIIDQYLYDENPTRPWIIGFSGGKDSTMLLQVVWNALKKIDPFLLRRRVYVVCNDTLVENPRIVKFINKTLNRIQKAATEKGIPLTVHQTMPNIENTFWVKLIGLGYPAPNKFFVYAPIKDVLTTELWQYLNQVPPPWGGTHKELVTLYRNANSGDCPLVIDESTPSCGNSRFGCWTCTVVNKDKSMEGLIDNGEDWMQPLADIRNFLIETRDNPEKYREQVKRDGTMKEGQWGPYKSETRAEILRRILKAQKAIQQTEGVELITHQE